MGPTSPVLLVTVKLRIENSCHHGCPVMVVRRCDTVCPFDVTVNVIIPNCRRLTTELDGRNMHCTSSQKPTHF